jgi:GMP synthase (glutamine-hydrolysing)
MSAGMLSRVMRPRIALLNASHNPAPTRRNFRRELDATLAEFHAPSGVVPETFSFDACVVTGSGSSVYHDETWIDDLRAWVDTAVGRGMPALGVCFGHQLLADVLGGTVDGLGVYELGYRGVSRRGESTLLSGLDHEFTAFATHSDYVTRLPSGATLLAANDYGVQAFRRCDVFGVQFHPEYDVETATRVTREKESVDEQRTTRALDGIDDDAYAAACETKALFDNFTDYVRRQREPGSHPAVTGGR